MSYDKKKTLIKNENLFYRKYFRLFPQKKKKRTMSSSPTIIETREVFSGTDESVVRHPHSQVLITDET